MVKLFSRNIIILFGAVLILATASPLSAHLASSRNSANDNSEMRFYPSGKWLSEMSLGHCQLVADIGWLAAIQYYGKHRLSDQNYEISPKLFSVITDADPTFTNAYLFASLVMTEAGYSDQAEALLREGVCRNPDSWRLHFDLGFFYYVIEKSWEKAANEFRAASQAPGAPDYTSRFAAAAYDKAGDESTARILWEVIAIESDNEEIRRMAGERLKQYAN